MSSIEDNIADEIRKEKNTRSEGKSEGEEAPKKKNLAFVIRPQNSKNSSRIQGKRPAQKSARPQQSARQNEAKAASGITGSTFGKVRCRKVTGCAAGSCSNCKSRNCCRTFNYRKTTGYASAVSSGKAAGSTSGKATAGTCGKTGTGTVRKGEKNRE